MLRIAIHLDRAVGGAGHQHRHGVHRKRMCGREIYWLAQNQIFRLLDVGINRFIRLLGAASQAGQRDRRPHQLHETAAGDRVYPLRHMLRKLPAQRFLKLRRVGQLVDGLPVLLAGLAGQPCLRRLLQCAGLKLARGVAGYGFVSVFHFRIQTFAVVSHWRFTGGT